MIAIDEPRLEKDLDYRFDYVSKFMGFGAEDVQIIHASAALLAPLVPSLVDAVYDKLYQQDSTWRHFLIRQHGYDGPTPNSLAELTKDHPMIKFRKDHLSRYLVAIVTKPYNGKMSAYLDMVGKIHTEKAGNRDIVVPIVQMNALMGFVSDAIIATIDSLDLSAADKLKATRAFNKLLWIQNDLIVRHYAR